MSILCNPDTSDDRKRVKTGKFLKTARLLCAIIVAATSFSSHAVNISDTKPTPLSVAKPYLVGLFLSGWFLKNQVAQAINSASDAVWPINKHNKSAEQSFADSERPIVVKTINAASQIALKLIVRDFFRKMGFEAGADTMATAFDAGIKASSVLKLTDAGIIPILREFTELFNEAITLPDGFSIKPSEYRYALNQPLDKSQGTAQRCGAVDPYCLKVPIQGPIMADSDLQNKAIKLGTSLALTAAGWKLADAAYYIGQVLSPILPRLLFSHTFGEDIAPGELEKYLQKVVQRFSEIQFGDVFVRALTNTIMSALEYSEKMYESLPEEKKNDPVARAKVAKDVEKTVVKDIVKGILGVIGYKVSWPTETAFIKSLVS